ncbi:hypothetical protein [Sphingomonas hankookensis]|uniref:hypothetical protein n=1 Tax=Sphingomonas hankookensis TaxID=563996 RepID=UPI003D301A09
MIGSIASHRPIGVLEPLAEGHGAFACSPNALSSWVMATGAGGRCIYARAARASGSLAERARLLARGGSIQINQARNTVDRTLFDFIATRTAKPVTVAATAIDKVPAFAVELLDLLESVAARRMACPTNAQMAAALGGVPSRRIGDTLRQLQDAGLVTVACIHTGHNQARTIHIIGTGETLCAA